MADHFYGVTAPGVSGNPDDVTFGTSTGSTVIELRVTDATTGVTGDKTAILRGLKAIENYIKQADHPV